MFLEIAQFYLRLADSKVYKGNLQNERVNQGTLSY